MPVMSTPKMYWLAPARHSTPLGAIALGNIIKDPRQPEIALNDPDSAAVKKLAAKAVPVDETRTFHCLTEGGSVRGNVLARLLDRFEAGAGVGHNHDTSAIYQIDKMTTQSINPTLSDIRAVFNEPPVQAAVRNSFFRANVYMIVGIRIVYGADVFASTVRAAGGFLHFRADLSAPAAGGLPPVSLGAALEAARSSGKILATRVSDKTPFVLAYRLREIAYASRKVREQREIAGDMFHHDDEEQLQVQGEGASDLVAVATVMLDEDPTLPQSYGVQTLAAEDVDDTRVELAVV